MRHHPSTPPHTPQRFSHTTPDEAYDTELTLRARRCLLTASTLKPGQRLKQHLLEQAWSDVNELCERYYAQGRLDAELEANRWLEDIEQALEGGERKINHYA